MTKTYGGKTNVVKMVLRNGSARKGKSETTIAAIR